MLVGSGLKAIIGPCWSGFVDALGAADVRYADKPDVQRLTADVRFGRDCRLSGYVGLVRKKDTGRLPTTGCHSPKDPLRHDVARDDESRVSGSADLEMIERGETPSAPHMLSMSMPPIWRSPRSMASIRSSLAPTIAASA